jgi:hypothetical protein
MSIPDGLDALQQQRAKASSRHAPPPRHAPPKAAPTAALPASAASPLPPAGQDPATGLIRASIYLDGPADEFLEDVRSAARRSTPKIDASRSAVVRLALLRLSDELTPADVVTQLRLRSQSARSGPGRKRL